MLAPPDRLPRGDWSYELKWDGFRAIVSTEKRAGGAESPGLADGRSAARACRPANRARARRGAGRVRPRLSEIISKAFLLAADDKIKDRTIREQIERSASYA